MNKNGQHSYKFLMIFHFGITIKIGHGLKNLARHAMERAFKAKNLARPPSWI